jgi:glycosyltransferase involved in cell wall biosynthesis
VIAAMPTIVERHPEAMYVVAGRTHPDVARRQGERYRLTLERAVVDLDLLDHVEFDDRYLPVDDIADLLAETDLFVTPYRELEQISSGALSFGIAAGCAVVSTPYWYAQDLLASGAGEIVPFADPAALAEAVCR